MKKILLFTLMLCCSAALKAQSGKFAISKDASGIISMTPPASGDAVYESIVFEFSANLKNAKINFKDTSVSVKNLFGTSKKLGVSSGNGGIGRTLPEPGWDITIKKSDGKYNFGGFSDTSGKFLMFSIIVDTTVFGPFALKTGDIVPPTPVPANAYKPGHILYDAIYLSSTANKDSIKYILQNYNINGTGENRYIDAALKNIFATIHGGKDFTASNLLSNLGSMDVTNLADGMAKFIVERTKQELNVAFFNDFYNTLKKPEFVDLQTVFPQTYDVLNVIGDQIYMYNAYIETLREAFKKDLNNLPENLPSIIDNHEAFFKQRPDLESLLKCGFYMAEQVRDKQHPGNIIHHFPIENLDNNKIDTNVTASIKTLQLVSKSLKGKNEAERYWAPEEDVQKLFSNDKTFLIYLGLLQQQAKIDEINFKHNVKKDYNKLWKIIDSAFNDYKSYKPYLKSVYSKIQGIESRVAALKTVSGDSAKLDNYLMLVNSSIDLMEQLSQAEKLPHFPPELNVLKNAKQYFYMARTASDLVMDVSRKNYASAIIDAVELYDTIFTTKNISKDPVLQKTAPLVKTYLIKYGSFMANIATASNSDQVEAAIEAVALPAGSSSVKRQSRFNVSLNAYCGLYGGSEYIKNVDPGWKLNSYGVTAPVGIAISTGKRHAVPIFGAFTCPKGGWSHSLFLSVVDIGALAAFRFQDDSTETIPNIQLQNILSPGLFYSMGIKGTPLSINVGYQVGPLLRKVNVTANENEYSQNYSRISLSFCVDIPLMNLYTRSGARIKKKS